MYRFRFHYDNLLLSITTSFFGDLSLISFIVLGLLKISFLLNKKKRKKKKMKISALDREILSLVKIKKLHFLIFLKYQHGRQNDLFINLNFFFLGWWLQ